MIVGFPWRLFWLCCALLALAVTVANAQDMPHMHELREIPADVTTPKVELALYKDEKSGFNLHIQVENYELEPPELATSKAPAVIQGHAHVFINGKKFSRVYAPYLHIPADALQQGINGITVTLNDHDHRVWTRDNKQVLATVFLDTRQSKPQIHYFSSSKP